MINPTFSQEKQLLAAGFSLVAGVDEAGSGAWAGPVYAGAVILPLNSGLGLIRDSKLLSPQQRQRVVVDIKLCATAWAVGVAEVKEIEALNIRQAGLLAMRRAIAALKIRPEFVLIDAFSIPNLGLPAKSIIHGDRLVKSIAAASIIAKCSRDDYMCELDKICPGYNFSLHKGYGTKVHQQALLELGPSSHHRASYAPIAKLFLNTSTHQKIPATNIVGE